jgi:hypothetical protein
MHPRLSIFLSLLILLALSTAAVAQDDDGLPSKAALAPAGDGPWLVRIPFDDKATVNALVNRIDVWNVYHDRGYLEAAVDPAQYRELTAEGLRVELGSGETS